jgi:hypothetical protein
VLSVPERNLVSCDDGRYCLRLGHGVRAWFLRSHRRKRFDRHIMHALRARHMDFNNRCCELLLQCVRSGLVWADWIYNRLCCDVHAVRPRYLLDGRGQHKLLGHHLRRRQVWPSRVAELCGSDVHIVRIWNVCSERRCYGVPRRTMQYGQVWPSRKHSTRLKHVHRLRQRQLYKLHWSDFMYGHALY